MKAVRFIGNALGDDSPLLLTSLQKKKKIIKNIELEKLIGQENKINKKAYCLLNNKEHLAVCLVLMCVYGKKH